MRALRHGLWSVVVMGVSALPALAQNTGGAGSNTGTGASGTGSNNGTLSGGSSLQGGNALSGANSGTPLLTATAPPKITAPSNLSNNSNTNINASNFLQKTYGNPYYQGYLTNYVAGSAPGGFGSPLYGTTTTTTGGGRGGVGGAAGGAVLTTNPGGTVVPLSRQISYPAQLQFKVPVVESKVFTDIRGMLDRCPTLSNPGTIQIVMNGANVVLRGNVKDNDESRFVEGMVRLTPGVREIKNELTYPQTP